VVGVNGWFVLRAEIENLEVAVFGLSFVSVVDEIPCGKIVIVLGLVK
jgi:hypothetical protein